MRSKPLLLASVCLILAACGSSGSDIACETTYEDENLTTCLPDGWYTVDRNELDDRGVPGEVTVAFQSDTPVSGQFSTITVTREMLGQPMTSEEYSSASIASVETLPGYTEVDKRSVQIDDADIDLHIFNAQPREDQPQSRFYQISVVSNGTEGYTLTGATPVAVPDELENQIVLILRSVSFQVDEVAEEDDMEE